MRVVDLRGDLREVKIRRDIPRSSILGHLVRFPERPSMRRALRAAARAT